MNEFGNTIKLLLYDEVATFPKFKTYIDLDVK